MPTGICVVDHAEYAVGSVRGIPMSTVRVQYSMMCRKDERIHGGEGAGQGARATYSTCTCSTLN